MKQNIVVVNLGNSTTGVIADLIKFSIITETSKTVVIAREGDKLITPELLEKYQVVTNIAELNAGKDSVVTYIVNGGTSRQLVPAVLWLERNKIQVKYLEVQREGVTVL